MRTVEVPLAERPPWLPRDATVRIPDGVAGLADLLEERWREPRRPLTALLPFHYHRVPARVRAWVAGLLLGGASASGRYPQHPWDPSVDALRWAAGLRPRWPEGRSHAVVLTHDVDSAAGLERLEAVLDVERCRGMRSTIFVCGFHYALDLGRLRALEDEGFEIASHGYNHDNRMAFLLESDRRHRLDAIESRFRPTLPLRGFRSSSLARTPALLASLQGRFAYDSSIPDLDFEGEGGCGTVVPYRIGSLVELPVTLPMDCSLLYQGLSASDVFRRWREKRAWVAEVGGAATAVLHPEPHLGGSPEMLREYTRFLEDLPPDAWVTAAHTAASHAAATFLDELPVPEPGYRPGDG